MILHGDCRTQLATLPDNSIDSIVTDPPYELGFMGKKWDASGIAYDPTVWAECLRVLKPGGHLLAFGGTRTYHRMTCAIEDAGFEIRDSLHWLYGSGFPKSLDVSKAIDKAYGHWRGKAGSVIGQSHSMENPHYERTEKGDPITPAAAAAGWGTALKPAHEPIVLARKPLTGTVAANVMEYGTGALNIDGTRVGTTVETWPRSRAWGARYVPGGDRSADRTEPTGNVPAGRWPANIILTHSPECEQVGTIERAGGAGTRCTNRAPDGKCLGHDNAGRSTSGQTVHGPDTGTGTETVAVWNCVAGCPVATLNEQSGERPAGMYPKQRSEAVATAFGKGRPTEGGARSMGDSGGAARYFTTTEWHPNIDAPFLYVAKPSRKERNAGLDGMPEKRPDTRSAAGMGTFDEKGVAQQSNFHPTVKPVALMRHLIKLVTPPNGTVLDPFLGSGTTAVAAILEGHDWIGCELTDDYLPIIEARVAWAEQNRPEPELTLFTEPIE